ncbi:MAG: AEC family transporter, partial [Trichococcus sp.]
MNDIITIALKAFPVIALITTGVVLEKTAFISADAVKGMKKLVLNLALPCLLFLILLDADLQTDYLWGSVAVFITCLLAFSMGFLFKKMLRSSNAFFPSVYSSFVTGIIGYPLFISTFGAEHLYRLAILDIGNLLFIFIVLATFLDKVGCNQTGRKRMSLKDQVKHIVKSPFLITMFLGILVSMLGGRTFFHTNPVTSALVAAAGMLADITLPLVLLVIGYELHFDLKQLLVPLPAVLLRISMMLLLAYLLNTFV